MEIEGYSNYLIYRDGRVENKKRKTFMKPYSNDSGRLRVNLTKNGKYKAIQVSRLVALYYIPNPDNLPCVDHIDGNKSNNDVSNLRWCSHIQNCQNRSFNKTNILKIKHIRKQGDFYQFRKTYHGKLYYESFKTLEEAIEYKENFLKNLDDVFIKG